MPDPLLNLIAQSTQVLTVSIVTPIAFPFQSGLSGPVIRPRAAIISVENYPIRWGPSPSAVNGILVPAGGTIDWSDWAHDYTALLQQVRFVCWSGPATLQIQYLT